MADQIRIGGLMRCCIQTLRELGESQRMGPPVEGDVVYCRWCHDSMRFREGAWEWNHD